MLLEGSCVVHTGSWVCTAMQQPTLAAGLRRTQGVAGVFAKDRHDGSDVRLCYGHQGS